jgi:hypothetical protein
MENLNRLKEATHIQWRVQMFNEQRNGIFASCVCYHDARDVMDRLDEVFGIGGWQRDHREIKGTMYGGVGVLIDGEWRWFWDAGTESNEEAEKGASSDSFKRACINIGIGRFMYSLPIIKIPAIQRGVNPKTNKPIYKPCSDPANEKSILWSGVDVSNYINSNLPALSRMSQSQLDAIMKPVQSKDGELSAALIKLLNKSLLKCTTPEQFKAFADGDYSVAPDFIKERLSSAVKQQMATHNISFDPKSKAFKSATMSIDDRKAVR